MRCGHQPEAAAAPATVCGEPGAIEATGESWEGSARPRPASQETCHRRGHARARRTGDSGGGRLRRLRLIYADRLRSHGPAWFGSGLVRGRLIGIYAILFGANLAVWAWAFVTFRADPVLFGTALLGWFAYRRRRVVTAPMIAG